MIVVITCVDPRVTTQIETSLGIENGSAFIIRIAGARFSFDGEVMQSLKIVVEQFGVSQIFVLGHTDCRAARVFGASEQDIVHDGMRLLKETPWLSEAISVKGAVLSLSNGEVSEV